MARYFGTILCGRAIVDAQMGTMSLIDVLDRIQIQAPGLSSDATVDVPLRFSIVTTWRREEGDPNQFQQRVAVVAPNGKRTELAEFPIDLSASVSRTAASANGLPVSGSGTYKIVVERKTNDAWENVDSVDLEVALMSIPET